MAGCRPQVAPTSNPWLWDLQGSWAMPSLQAETGVYSSSDYPDLDLDLYQQTSLAIF